MTCKKRLLGAMVAAVLTGCQAMPPGVGAPTEVATPRSGSLTIRIEMPGQPLRRVQTLVEAVERLTVALKTADGTDYEREIQRSEILGHSASASFTGLLPGRALVTLRAYDGQQRRVSEVSREVEVASGAATSLSMDFRLNGQWASSPMPLSLDPVTALPTSTVTATVAIPYGKFRTLATGSEGNAWVQTADGWFKLGADGSLAPKVGGAPTAPLIDGAGNHWMGGGTLRRYAPDGTPLDQFLGLSGIVAIAEAGHLWLGQGTQVHRVSTSGVVEATADVGGTVEGLAVAPGGRLWVRMDHGVVRQLGPDGQVLTATRVPASITQIEVWENLLTSMAADAAGNLWVASLAAGKVTKIGTDGSIVGDYPACAAPRVVAVDGSGHVWVGGESQGKHNVVKLAPDGTLVGALTLGPVLSAATDAAGAVWMATWATSGTTVHRLGP